FGEGAVWTTKLKTGVRSSGQATATQDTAHWERSRRCRWLCPPLPARPPATSAAGSTPWCPGTETARGIRRDCSEHGDDGGLRPRRHDAGHEPLQIRRGPLVA